MKRLVFILLLMPFLSFTQSSYKLDSIGNDESSLLNLNELNYTEHLLTYLYGDSAFNLNQKKILFLTGSCGSKKVSKSVFFNSNCKPWTIKQDMPHIQIIVLTEEEKNEIGYELILVAWSKIPAEGKARKKFINNARQLKSTYEIK